MRGIFIVFAAALITLAGGGATFSPAMSDSVVGPDQYGLSTNSSHFRLVQDAGRVSCEFGCRSRFGYELYSSGRGSGSGNYYAFAACMQACNRKFWKEFDKKMDDLKNE
jgi:hypothetical protein